VTQEMTAYFARLACLSFACFFLVNLAASFPVALVTPRFASKARELRADSAARWILALRLSPAVAAIFAVAALCIPSYLWLEPAGASEDLGIACTVAAALGFAVAARSLWRASHAFLRSRRLTRSAVDEISIVDAPGAFMATTGLARPRILVSRAAADLLSPVQFDAAVLHERAHWTSRDNLKRLLQLAAPDPFPFWRGPAIVLDHEWARYAEFAADDRATGGDVNRCVALAEALVRLARAGAPPPIPLATSLIADSRDLAARVDRLLSGVAPLPPAHRPWKTAGIVAASLACCATIANPASLALVHNLLERFFK
jgi:beta-lactamase regulating signal transducer with metallopeptidase domain